MRAPVPPWQPTRLTLVIYKAEKQLAVWGHGPRKQRKRLAVYPILAASGGPGPKRREGDRQVPEGIYRLTQLNPASRFHRSIRVDYPNAEDIAYRTVPRSAMGGDIYIHGGAVSIGCVALGDPAIEQVYALVRHVGLVRCVAVFVPCDLVRTRMPESSDPWVRGLYSRLRRRLWALEGLSEPPRARQPAEGSRPGRL